jgi:hypothetical protein
VGTLIIDYKGLAELVRRSSVCRTSMRTWSTATMVELQLRQRSASEAQAERQRPRHGKFAYYSYVRLKMAAKISS